jgi:UbiD family decarboxylase
MPRVDYPDLRGFLSQLKRAGDLVHIDAPVDAHLEIAEIHRRVIAAGGPALFFENVKDSRFPVVTNLFGTRKRVELAFGKRPKNLIKQLVGLLESGHPPTLGDLWRNRSLAGDLMKMRSRKVRSGPVCEVLQDEVRLSELPALTSWPEDGGPFITLPLVYTEHPKQHGHNLGMYRLQVHDEQTTGMHWQIGKGGGFHYAAAEASQRALPVSVFLGGPPALILAAISPLPENAPELVLAALVAGRRLRTIERSDGHPVLADLEFALLGQVPPAVRHPEGPFGDHYGYYSLQHDYPVFRVEEVFHRADAIYPATVVGKPRQEDFFIGDYLQELLSPLISVLMPSVVDLWSYGETGYHSLAAARVRERYKREAMMSAFRILGEGQLSLTKFLLIIDQAEDLRNFRSTLQHVLCRTRTETDLYVFSNLSMDTLDYTGPRVNEGSKGVWLGLGDPVRELPSEFGRVAEVPVGLGEVRVFCPGCLVVGGPTFEADPVAGKRFAEHPAFRQWPLLVLTDEPERTAASAVNFLWTTFTRFEPASDLYANCVSTRKNHICYEMPILIDARRKSGFPEELHCSSETSEQVSSRWKEYFPSGVEMGDSESAHLDPVGD